MISSRKILVLCLFMLSLSVQAGSVVISPVNIVSPLTGEIVPDQAILVVDQYIAKIVPVDQIDLVLEAGKSGVPQRIDGKSGYIIPGLSEMHAHVPSKRRGEQYARDILTLFLANGVTTIRGMLGERWHLELRDLLKHQEWPGPLLVTSGPSFNGNSVSSPSQAAQRVRDQHAVGYDFLKLHPGLAADEYAAIARTAAGLGIPIAGHVSVEVGLDATLEAQQASIDHLDGYAQNLVPAGSDLHGVAPEFFGINLSSALDPDIASHLAESTAAAEVWNVPTQSLLENIFGNSSVETLLNRDGMRYAGSDLKQSWVGTVERSRAAVSTADQQKFIQSRRRLVFELQQAGAGLLLGSDAPQIMNVPGFSVHEELEFLVLAGLTPLQALQSGTINTARFFGDKERGLVSKDMLADFVLLSDNPLINISATRNILGVMRGGHWYSRSALDKLLAGVAGRGL